VLHACRCRLGAKKKGKGHVDENRISKRSRRSCPAELWALPSCWTERAGLTKRDRFRADARPPSVSERLLALRAAVSGCRISIFRFRGGRPADRATSSLTGGETAGGAAGASAGKCGFGWPNWHNCTTGKAVGNGDEQRKVAQLWTTGSADPHERAAVPGAEHPIVVVTDALLQYDCRYCTPRRRY